tara:strand:- start:553 stop:897 length:345 start_codon:yes stop_codon:yes gene_type:complete
MYGNRGNKGPSGNPINEPAGLPKTAFGHAKGNISSSVVYTQPMEVVIQGVGNATFKYDCTSTIGSGIAAAGFNSGDTITIADTDNDGMIRLPISPCAVSASGATNVTFIYQGGL